MQRRHALRLLSSPRVIAQARGTLLGELSTETLQLHLCAALVSADTNLPGFVPDTFLATIHQDLTLALTELDVTGTWRREHDGYQMSPRALSRVIATLQDLVEDL